LKKFAIKTSLAIREINANEYSVFPKTNTFTATVKGISEFAASTSGKGKSAIPNYYLYFRSEGTLYYFKSNPEEISAAKGSSGFIVAESIEALEKEKAVEATVEDVVAVAADRGGEPPELVGAEVALSDEPVPEKRKGRRR
jgi:hypothetical protein